MAVLLPIAAANTWYWQRVLRLNQGLHWALTD
jgi:hypothetical protein